MPHNLKCQVVGLRVSTNIRINFDNKKIENFILQEYINNKPTKTKNDIKSSQRTRKCQNELGSR